MAAIGYAARRDYRREGDSRSAADQLRLVCPSPVCLVGGVRQLFGGKVFKAVALVVSRSGWLDTAAISRVEQISWKGGALGGIYIAISIFALPRIGVALLLALIVVGQMLASLAVARVGGVLLMKTG